MVVPGRAPLEFSRIYDSRIRDNPDFGPGWRLALDEQIILNSQDTASYTDSSGAWYDFQRSTGDQFLPVPKSPRLVGTRLTITAGKEAVLTTDDGEVRMFERKGEEGDTFLLRRIERSGRAWIEISRREGLIWKVSDLEGEVVRLERGTGNRITAALDRHHRRVTYEYEGSGRLLRTRDLGGNSWTYQYDEGNRLTGVMDPNGDIYFRSSYDAAGRVARSIGEGDFVFEYEPQKTVVGDRMSGTRQVFERTAAGMVLAFSSSTGVAWRLTHDAAGRVERLEMSEVAARFADLGAGAFHPDGTTPSDEELGSDWARLVRLVHSAHGVTATETVSSKGKELRHYEYGEHGRLARAWSSTGGIPVLQVEYGDITSLRTGWNAPRTEFEFRTGRDGSTLLVGNGHQQIEIERGRLGGVRALQSGTRWASFRRDQLGRISELQTMEGAIARYYRDALGYRTLTEYSGGGSQRVAVDATGRLGGVESTDALGQSVLKFGSAAPGSRMGLLEDSRSGTPSREEIGIAPVDVQTSRFHGQSLELLDQLRISAPDERNDSQPYYGGIEFDAQTFAPRVRDPLRAGVPGLEDALALAPLAGDFLSSPNSSLRMAFESYLSPSFRPLEHGRSMSSMQTRFVPTLRANGAVPEIVVRAPRPQVVGYFTDHCIDDGTLYSSVDEACDTGWGVRSFTEPGNGRTQCTRCADGVPGFGAGFIGGGGGQIPVDNGVEEEEEEEEEDDCEGVTEITAPNPDPQLSGLASLSTATQEAYRCLDRAVGENGGKLKIESAYRSQSYQTHLLEVWTKYHIVVDWPDTQCAQVKGNVKVEWDRHHLLARPATVSNHTTRTAFDARWGTLSGDADIDTLARQCNLSRPLPVADPVHFVLN